MPHLKAMSQRAADVPFFVSLALFQAILLVVNIAKDE
jgi:hypothetical protein